MTPYPSGSGTVWAPVPGSENPSPADLDGLLAGAGYRVRSSDLRDVARNLERLDSVIGSAPVPDLCGAHYNPSDLTAWVDSMLSEVTQPEPAVLLRNPANYDTWTDQIPQPPPHHLVPTVIARHREEEDSGIRLVHLLMSCADSVQRGEPRQAANLLEEMKLVLTRVNTVFGIGKVAGYFADAISRRLYSPGPSAGPSQGTSEHEILYHHFYEACPLIWDRSTTVYRQVIRPTDN